MNVALPFSRRFCDTVNSTWSLSRLPTVKRVVGSVWLLPMSGRVFLVVAEIAVGEIAALDAERIETDGAAGHTEQIRRQQRQRGFGVGRADNLARRSRRACATPLPT